MPEPPPGIQRDFPMARLTTIGAGGPAECFAAAGGAQALRREPARAAEEAMEVGVVGSGSNLLGAGKGARGPVVKLEGDLSKIDVDETNRMILCCGGTRLSRGRWRGCGHGPVPPDGRAP